MTLRAGMSTCTEHTTIGVVKKRLENIVMSETTVSIFYDLKVTSTIGIEQISAVSADGDNFNEVKTFTRKSNRPVIRKFRPKFTWRLPPTSGS